MDRVKWPRARTSLRGNSCGPASRGGAVVSVSGHNRSKTREVDVVARFEWTSFVDNTPCGLTVAIECKFQSSSAEANADNLDLGDDSTLKRPSARAGVTKKGESKPWAAFYADEQDPQNDAGMARMLDHWVVFAYGPYNGITEPLAGLWIGHPLFTSVNPATHVVSAFGGDNTANGALCQVLSATHSIRQTHLQHQKSGLVCLAAVVTTAPLFACRLAGDGSIIVEQVEEFDVWGIDPAGGRQRVYVRTESTAAAFAAAIRARVQDANNLPTGAGVALPRRNKDYDPVPDAHDVRCPGWRCMGWPTALFPSHAASRLR